MSLGNNSPSSSTIADEGFKYVFNDMWIDFTVDWLNYDIQYISTLRDLRRRESRKYDKTPILDNCERVITKILTYKWYVLHTNTQVLKTLVELYLRDESNLLVLDNWRFRLMTLNKNNYLKINHKLYKVDEKKINYAVPELRSNLYIASASHTVFD